MPLAMAQLVLKWLWKKPATSRYPFEPRIPLAGSRGRLNFDNANCVYCKLCEKKCPTDALVVDRTKKTWAIDRLRCINCGACVEACPKKSLALAEMHQGPAVTRDREYPGAVEPAPAAVPAPTGAAVERIPEPATL